MIHSFRLRMALLSALLTGLVLLLFGAASWWLIRESKTQRLDTELRAYAEREVNRERSADEWQAEEARIASTLGLTQPGEVLLLWQDAAGQTLYQSSGWPSAWPAAQLPWPDGLMPRPPPGEGPPHRVGEPPRPPRPGLGDEPPPVRRPPGPAVALLQGEADGQRWRLALARIDVAQLAIAVNAQAIEADLRGIRNAFLLSLPLALLLTGLASWAFAHRAMAPIDKLAQATRRVTAGGLEQRIPSGGEDREFVLLIEVFNRMLGRLERSFQQAHRFSADAAHELKTPLAIVQGQLERAIHQAEDGSAMQTGLSSILDEVRRLSVISRKLLLLSQADAGHLSILREPVDLSRLLDELLEDTRMLAPQLRVDADVAPGLRLQADASLLRQVLHNLVSNAIKYNVPDGWIQIGAARRGPSVEVLVRNASTGIAAADQARLFERFFRADQAHGRQVEGVGLGLSVSREIARAHGGELMLKAASQTAVQFSLVLPMQ